MRTSHDDPGGAANRHRFIRQRLEALSGWVRGSTPDDDVAMFVDTAEVDMKAREAVERIQRLIETPLEDSHRESLASQICRLQIVLDDLKLFCGTTSGPLERLRVSFYADGDDEETGDPKSGGEG